MKNLWVVILVSVFMYQVQSLTAGEPLTDDQIIQEFSQSLSNTQIVCEGKEEERRKYEGSSLNHSEDDQVTLIYKNFPYQQVQLSSDRSEVEYDDDGFVVGITLAYVNTNRPKKLTSAQRQDCSDIKEMNDYHRSQNERKYQTEPEDFILPMTEAQHNEHTTALPEFCKPRQMLVSDNDITVNYRVTLSPDQINSNQVQEIETVIEAKADMFLALANRQSLHCLNPTLKEIE